MTLQLQVEARVEGIVLLQRHSRDVLNQALPPILCVRFEGHSINCACGGGRGWHSDVMKKKGTSLFLSRPQHTSCRHLDSFLCLIVQHFYVS